MSIDGDDIKAALREMERVMLDNPRIREAVNLARSCPTCESRDIRPVYSEGIRRCRACGHTWPI